MSKSYRQALLEIMEWMDDHNIPIKDEDKTSIILLVEAIEDWAFDRGMDTNPPGEFNG